MRFSSPAKILECFARQFFILWLATGFILFGVLVIRAERLPIKIYAVADGLLRDNVYKIKQDSRGDFWVATTGTTNEFRRRKCNGQRQLVFRARCRAQQYGEQ